VISKLGQGSFGQVINVYDHKDKKNIALKIIRNKKKFTYQANVEIKILKDIRQNDSKDKSNIIKILESFNFRNHI
jgi:dual specificity tyrosine-phosphorylation-regulated kinase 2/3/4